MVQSDQFQELQEGFQQELDGAQEICVIWDGGAGDNKIICGKKRISIPSAVAPVKMNTNDFNEAPKKKENRIVVKFNDNTYAIGQHAVDQRTGIRRRLDQEELGRETHKLILLGGLVIVAPLRAYVNLITNIPISYWGYRDRMYGLAGGYTGEYGTKRFYYFIDQQNIDINPESRGVIIAHCFDATGRQVHSFNGETVAVVDAGTHTVNVGVYKGLKFDYDSSFTITNVGKVSVWRHCQQLIGHEYGREPLLEDIEEALRSNKGILKFGADSIDLNIKKYAPQGYEIVAHKITTEINNHLEGGKRFSRLIGGGGTYPDIMDHIAEVFPKHILLPDQFPALSNLDPWEYNAAGLERRMLNQAARANGKQN